KDRIRHRVALGCGARKRACRGADRWRGMGTPVHEGQDVAELTDAELLEEKRGHARWRAAPVDRMRDRAQRFEAAPHRRAFVADEVAPTTGAVLFTFLVASVCDRARACDQHDAAAGRIPR